MSPTFIAQGAIGLNLICGNYVSRWHIDSVIVEAYCFELWSLVRYKTTLSSPWKRSPPAKAASRPVGSTSGTNGIDGEWGSSILYVKYRLLSSIDGFPLYVVGCHSSRSSFLIWRANMFCMATKFSIAFAKFGTFKPVMVTDCRRYFAILLCLKFLLFSIWLRLMIIDILLWYEEHRRKLFATNNPLEAKNHFFKYFLILCLKGETPASRFLVVCHGDLFW